jgi:hypothetical protein
MVAQENVMSLPLFDPNNGRPPADAVELYLEAPRSLGIFYSAAISGHQNVYVDAVNRIRVMALNDTLRVIQREGGYLKVGQHTRLPSGRTVGKFLPGKLFISAVSDVFSEGHEDVARLHEHVYVGGYGLCDEDRQTWPVDLDTLKNQVLLIAQVHYSSKIQNLTAQVLDVKWNKPIGFATTELVEPPMYQHLNKYPRVMCKGPFATKQQWVSRNIAPTFETHAV